MKRLCYFVALTILSMLGFQGYAQDVQQATVKISGQFYTAVAQNVDDNRDEAFAFTNGTYDNETQEFSFTPDATYSIKLQNQANQYYVYVNGVALANEYSAEAGESGYKADVKFNAGDVVEIYETTPYVAHVVVNGQFYTLAAQDVDEPRNEAFSFTNGNFMYEGREFTFAPGVTYAIKAQNQNNSFYVYVNGVALANEVEAPATGYEAKVQFRAGDNVEIYEYTPYTAEVTVNGQFYTIAAQGVDNNRQEAFAFTNATYDNENLEFEFEPGVTYQIKAQNQSNSIFVYVNGVAVANELDADATGYQGSVKFNPGDEVAIYENTPYAGTVTVSGQFYTINAQNVDNPRDEAFTFYNGTYSKETRDFYFTPEATYAIKIQNYSNRIYVLVNGELLANELDADQTGYQAEITFSEGDVVEITESNPFGGIVTVDGQFYTINAQSVDDPRDEAFTFTNDTYDHATREFTFTAGATYALKMQNASNQFYVYVNGVEIANELDADQTGYQANIQFKGGDVVEIYETTPYVAHVVVNGQFYTLAAQDVDEPRNEAFSFTYGNYMYEGREFTFAPGVTYAIKAQNETNSFYVYINGEAVANELDADATGYQANVKFNAGDEVEIYQYTPYVANVTVTGQFYTIAAQDADEPRNEAFAFTNATYDNETAEFEFAPGTTYLIKIQNQSNNIFVYVNGEELANELDADQTGYQASIKFQAGDEVQIFETNPYVATVVVNGEFYTIAAQDIDEPRNEAFSIPYGSYTNETREFSFNPSTTYLIKAQNPSNTFYVFVNDVRLENQVDADATGYEAEIQFNAGDVVKIYDNDPMLSINGITVENNLEGRIFNLQGIEIKAENITPGFYIVNGVKTYIR